MNLSGEAVRAAFDFYKVSEKDLLVIHDDLDVNFGQIKYKTSGGHGGQNGVRSIIGVLGSKAFARIKIGIKNDQKEVMGASNFVLGRFNKEEQQQLPAILDLVGQKAENWEE